VAYVWQATKSAATPAGLSANSPAQPAVTPQIDATIALTAAQSAPRLFALDLDQLEQRGYIKVATLAAPNQPTMHAPLRCWRMHFAAGRGICLQEALGDWLTPVVAVTIFDESFQPLYTRHVDGYPSRARVAPDGKYAALTVFVSGHSYNDENFSTATHIWEVATGQDLGNLETFEVRRDGEVIREIDFNFWGVTFAKESNRFYATLSSGGIAMLVEGDIATRRMLVLREGVECPSLSPDNRRIAFKKARGNGEWQLAVLDLATRQETILAEPRSVDDQVEWLDDSTILYQQMEYDSTQNVWINVLRIPADGTGAPSVFATRVGSPAVVY
jgi:hypothetical protein